MGQFDIQYLVHVRDDLSNAFGAAQDAAQVLEQKGAPMEGTAAGHTIFSLRHLVHAITDLTAKVEFLLQRAAEEDTAREARLNKRLADPEKARTGETKIDVILHPDGDILVNLPPTVGVRLTYRGKQYGKWLPVTEATFASPSELLYCVESICRDLRQEGFDQNRLTEGVSPEPGRATNWFPHNIREG